MTKEHREQRPGDLILDRYMPNATKEEREVARENLRRFAEVIFGIQERVDRERDAL